MRRFFLVSYDIPDDKRRNRVFKLLTGWGDHVQYSVFCCQLNPRECHQLEEHLRKILKQNEDQVLLVDVGLVEGEHPEPEISYIGRVWKPDVRSQIV